MKLPKTFIAGIICITLSGACYVSEHVFYNYVDENGVLQESLFIPLTLFFGFIGLVLLVVAAIIHIRAATR
ncbi:MAG: DUF3955 domain-containing protein [Hyphomicrobiales bacterium]|nr:DUF3955 domain-containing protein [Hyphomicrobiales bacterium]